MISLPQEFEVYFSEECVSKADAHFAKMAERKLEAMGLLVGKFHLCNGKQWVFCEDYITSENNATAVSVRFTSEAFEELVKELQARRQISPAIIVGWAHSHPGYGCFLSSTDVATQEKFFDHPQSIALVIDPLRRENGKSLKRVFRVRNGASQEESFAVIRKKR